MTESENRATPYVRFIARRIAQRLALPRSAALALMSAGSSWPRVAFPTICAFSIAWQCLVVVHPVGAYLHPITWADPMTKIWSPSYPSGYKYGDVTGSSGPSFSSKTSRVTEFGVPGHSAGAVVGVDSTSAIYHGGTSGMLNIEMEGTAEGFSVYPTDYWGNADANAGAEAVVPIYGQYYMIWTTENFHGYVFGPGGQINIFGTKNGVMGGTYADANAVLLIKREPEGWSYGGGDFKESATVYWGLNGVPGSSAPTATPLPHGAHSYPPIITGPVDPPNDVTGSYLADLPAGLQGIGTTTPWHTVASVDSVITAPNVTMPQHVALAYTTTGPLFSHFQIPTALASGADHFVLSYNGLTVPLIAGQDFNFLDTVPGGVNHFTVSGVDRGTLGTTVNPLDVETALTFTASGTARVEMVATALDGDANLDGIVNGQDIALTASNWLSTGANLADLNFDGIVNGQDFAIVASNWLSAAGGSGSAATAVPEPSTLLLMVLGALGLLTRRSRHA